MDSKPVEKDQGENKLTLTSEEVAKFMQFLTEKPEYLDDALGVFHTDNHGNW